MYKNRLPFRAALFVWFYLAAAATAVVVIAAAEEQDDQSDDDDPGAVVVKEVAKAVVIHKVSPFGEAFRPPDTIL